MHSNWSDGSNTIYEMAKAAQELGHEYILITDHVGKAGLGSAMDQKNLVAQRKEIEEAGKKLKIKILQGAEVNIQSDGSIDVDSEYLKNLDIVLASIHFGFKDTEEKMTNRIIKAMENEHIDIIAHPTGRLLNKRKPYDLNFDKVLEKAKETNTVLEVNAMPHRLDLNDIHIRAAIKAKVKLSIGTDSHNIGSLANYKLAIYMARRGWAEKKDIVNTYSIKDMLRLLK